MALEKKFVPFNSEETFVAPLRKVMVDDTELPFPGSAAATEINKSGSQAGGGLKFLFGAMITGALITLLGKFKVFLSYWETFNVFGTQNFAGLSSGRQTYKICNVSL